MTATREKMPSLIDRVAQLAKQARVTKGHKLQMSAACVQTNIHHPSEEKVLSLFEPHTRVIPRHKGGTEVELGRLVTLDEVEGGTVTRFEILE